MHHSVTRGEAFGASLSTALVFAVLGLFAPAHAGDACDIVETVRLRDQAAVPDRYGSALALSGDVAVVGAPFDDGAGEAAGAIRIYRFEHGWSEETLLRAGGLAPQDEFGAAVAASGDTIAVASDAHGGTGAVFVYRAVDDAWTEDGTLGPDGSQVLHIFGVSVAMSGDTIVVGDIGDEAGAGFYAGAAYVFRRGQFGWAQEAKLIPDDVAMLDLFGISVAISGDVIAVGATGSDDEGSESGAVHVFRRSGTVWTEEAKLTASDGEVFDQLGAAVAVDGDVVVAGAKRADPLGFESGAAYVFRRTDGWSEEQKLVPAVGGYRDHFGHAVSVSGDLVVVGAIATDVDELEPGAAFAFLRTQVGWTETARLIASDGDDGDGFGWAIAVDGDRAVIGATPDDPGAVAGTVYAVHGLADCNENERLDACDLIDGTSTDADEDGVPDECASSCPRDLDGSGDVGFLDLVAVLADWGSCQDCATDIDDSGAVDFLDLLEVLAWWGPCGD